MTRLNFLADEPWDEHLDELQIKVRYFGRPHGAKELGASLHELLPGSPGAHLHAHYDGEEMFFVLSGHPTLRTGEGKEPLSPGDVVFCPSGIAGLHTIMNETDEPARILAVSSGHFPDVVVYPEKGWAWVATRDPDKPVPEGGDAGIIAKFPWPPSD
jgi:uncharacterized cupin superfamily protein